MGTLNGWRFGMHAPVLLLLAVSLVLSVPAAAAPYISEVMAANNSVIQDEDGDYSDWIELYNPGDEAVDLSGYGLSDNPDNPYKWRFVTASIPAGGYLLVFASGKDRPDPPYYWETVVRKDDDWRYFRATVAPPADWRDAAFDDSGWTSGAGGFGSLAALDRTIISKNTPSICIRKSFTIADTAAVSDCLLQIDYQHAFVAYLNGTELRRANIGVQGTTPAYDTMAEGYSGSELARGEPYPVYQVREIRPLLVPGTNVLAIEVHNTGMPSMGLYSDLSVVPNLTLRLTSKPSPLRGVPDDLVFSIPEDEPYYLHTGYKVASAGETLVLTNPTGTTLDRVDTGSIPGDRSAGRVPGSMDWVLLAEPTPGAQNTGAGYHGVSSAVVAASVPGGRYDAGVTVALSTGTAGAVIRYTLTGANPDETSPLYTAPLSIDTTTVLKASAFEPGLLPGPVCANSYFIADPTTIAILSMSTHPDNFFDEEIGFLYGDSYSGTGNWMEDWERPVHLEFFEPDGSFGFSADVGVQASGVASRRRPQHPMRLFARKGYGDTKIAYQIFPHVPVAEFERLELRVAGNENPINTFYRDAMIHTLVRGLDLEVQAYRPCSLFLNGAYWGVYNLRERADENTVASHHGLDPADIDYIQYTNDPNSEDFDVISGSPDDFLALAAFFEECDLSDPDAYERVSSWIDLDNFIDSVVTEIYAANKNWPGHNFRAWRVHGSEGRWRWPIQDLDWGFYITLVHDDMVTYATDPASGLAGHNTIFFRKLLENPDFKYRFINRIAGYCGTIFRPEVVVATIDSLSAERDPEMQREIARWVTAPYYFDWMPDTYAEWLQGVEETREFARRRIPYLQQHVVAKFGLSGTADLTVTVTPADAGQVRVDTVFPDADPWTATYFKDVPVPFTALPAFGYRFVGWQGASTSTDAELSLILTGATALTAVFEKVADDVVLAREGSPYTFEVSQTVTAGHSLTVEAGVEILMGPGAAIIVNGSLVVNGTEEEPVVIHALDDREGWDAIRIADATAPCVLTHMTIRDARAGADPVMLEAAVMSLNSEVTLDGCIFENNLQCFAADGGAVIVRGCTFENTNRSEHIHIVRADAPLVEECLFRGVNNEDAIDFDFVTDGVIRNNRILRTMNPDCDGIDIGDLCDGLLITGNTIYDCFDKGISVGEDSQNVRIENNVIAGCDYGIAVKDSSTAVIDHVTLYGNRIAVAAYEKGARYHGGGNATVTNAILSGSTEAAVYTDVLSTITFSWSLAETEILPGTGNLNNDPMFTAGPARLFVLLPDSPAINSGDPAHALDEDGSRTDMGASVESAQELSVVINEINYRSANDFDPDDWVELYNPLSGPVDMSGWAFMDEDDTHRFVIPSDTVLDAGSYLVLCRNLTAFQTLFPSVTTCLGGMEFGLNNGGELIRMYDARGVLVDYVVYDDEDPWAFQPDGNGPTLALRDASLDNSLPESWRASLGHGTPGGANGPLGVAEEPGPLAFSLGANYPNPFNPSTTIPFTIAEDGKVSLTVYNLAGQWVRELVAERLTAGEHTAVWDGRDTDGRTVASGVYLARLVAGEREQVRRMLLMK